MKNIVLLLLSLLSFQIIFAQEIGSAVEYSDYIVERQTQVANAINALMEKMGTVEKEECEAQLLKSMKVVDYQISLIEDAKPYGEGAEMFRERALELMRFYRSTINEEYRQVIELVYSDQADMDKLQPIMDKIVEKETPLDDKFANAQKVFAANNGFKLVD